MSDFSTITIMRLLLRNEKHGAQMPGSVDSNGVSASLADGAIAAA